jgi:hypothetical protein
VLEEYSETDFARLKTSAMRHLEKTNSAYRDFQNAVRGASVREAVKSADLQTCKKIVAENFDTPRLTPLQNSMFYVVAHTIPIIAWVYGLVSRWF